MLNNIGLMPLILLLYIIFLIVMSIYALINVSNKDERFVYGGFWLRLIAYVIDSILLTVVSTVVGAVFGFLIGASMVDAPLQAIEDTAGAVGGLLGLFITWVYFAAMHSSKWQATLGKKAVGLIVVDKEGNRIGFGRATGRLVATFLSYFLLLLGYFMAGWTKRKRSLHDMIAGTLVVKSGQ